MKPRGGAKSPHEAVFVRVHSMISIGLNIFHFVFVWGDSLILGFLSNISRLRRLFQILLVLNVKYVCPKLGLVTTHCACSTTSEKRHIAYYGEYP